MLNIPMLNKSVFNIPMFNTGMLNIIVLNTYVLNIMMLNTSFDQTNFRVQTALRVQKSRYVKHTFV